MMNIGDRVQALHSVPSNTVRGTVKEVREAHVSVHWDGWSAPRWIQTRGLEPIQEQRSGGSNETG